MYPSGENLRKWYSYIIAPLDGKLDVVLCATNRRQLTGNATSRLAVRMPMTATEAQSRENSVVFTFTRSYRASECMAVSVQAE